MSFQAYLDNIKAKTGKSPDDFRALAKKNRLTRSGEIVQWLKSDFSLGHGHAMAIAHLIVHADDSKRDSADRLEALFSGSKARWRPAYDALAAQLARFGSDLALSPNRTYINVLRGGKKLALLQPSSVKCFDIGIKLPGIAPAGRFEKAGSWNAMVTHRVRIAEPGEIDAELLSWLRKAYEVIAKR